MVPLEALSPVVPFGYNNSGIEHYGAQPAQQQQPCHGLSSVCNEGGTHEDSTGSAIFRTFNRQLPLPEALHTYTSPVGSFPYMHTSFNQHAQHTRDYNTRATPEPPSSHHQRQLHSYAETASLAPMGYIFSPATTSTPMTSLIGTTPTHQQQHQQQQQHQHERTSYVVPTPRSATPRRFSTAPTPSQAYDPIAMNVDNRR